MRVELIRSGGVELIRSARRAMAGGCRRPCGQGTGTGGWNAPAGGGDGRTSLRFQEPTARILSILQREGRRYITSALS